MKIFCLSVMLVVVTICLVTNEASFPSNKDNHPDGFWFGTQNLNCMLGKMKRTKRNPWRWIWDWSHRVIYYRGYVYEQRPPVLIQSDPNWPAAISCPVSWESSPAASSQCSTSSVMNFANGYSARYGGYNFLWNNCHSFANRVSDFLTDKKCGAKGMPS